VIRSALDRLEENNRSIVAALHANSNIAGEELQKHLAYLHMNYLESRMKILGAEREDEATKVEDEFVSGEWWMAQDGSIPEEKLVEDEPPVEVEVAF
jgi:hypothetical protein